MRTSVRSNALLSLFAYLGFCLNVADGAVQFGFSRQPLPPKRLTGRDTFDESIQSQGYVFVVNATVGTPGQKFSLLLSPSGSDTWVPDATSSYCGGDVSEEDDSFGSDDESTNYCLWGSFDKSASSTYLTASQGHQSFDAYYPDGNQISGVNGTDTLRVGDLELTNFPIGIADTTDQWIGVLGLGANTSSTYLSGSYNFPDRIVREGKCNTKAYSIWLDDPEGSTGSILFGAIDTSKYQGELMRLDGYSPYSITGSFGVKVDGMNGSRNASDPLDRLAWNEFPFDASISPAEVLSNLPRTLASDIWSIAGATYDNTYYRAVIPCDAAAKHNDSEPHFSIRLGRDQGPVLNVKLSDLILPKTVGLGPSYMNDLDLAPNTCLFGVQNGSRYDTYDTDSTQDYYYNIGSSLLRRTYMVFDIENEEVAVAPTRFTDRPTPTVVEFATYGATVPSSTLICDTSSAYYNCDPRVGDGDSGGSGDGYDYYGDDSPGLDLLLGVGLPFGIIGLIGLAAATVAWKRLLCGPREKSEKAEAEAESGTRGGQDVGAAAAAASALNAHLLAPIQESEENTPAASASNQQAVPDPGSSSAMPSGDERHGESAGEAGRETAAGPSQRGESSRFVEQV